STPLLDGYAAAASAMPSALVEELVKVRKLVHKRSIKLRLAVDPAVAGLPWEALLGVALGVQRDPELIGRLRGERRGDATAAQCSRHVEGVTAVAKPTWLPLIEYVWKIPGGPRTRTTLPLRVEAGGIVHVIGTAVRTAEGILLSVGDGSEKGSAEA